MKKTISLLLLTIILFTIPKNTFAWGKEGHHIISEIAFNYLDEATKQAVKHYLEKMSFEEAAEWMDDNRSNSYYDFMKPWHYIDIAKGQTYQPSKEKNVLTVLNSAIIALEHKEGLKDRQIKEYLLLVFHLVGDLHQPLHTGYPNDKGGNLVIINSPIYNGNLHSLWDTQIIESKGITLADCLKLYNGLNAQDLADVQKINVLSWMNQSRMLLDNVYDFKDEKINEAYINAAVPIIEK